MANTKREMLYGWGHCPVVQCLSYRPEKRRELSTLITQHKGHLLARGLGRSYGDAPLQPAGVLRTDRLDHMISFDAATGVVRAQAGVTLAELMEVIIPRGWFPPVIPGTKYVTLGGAFACNVHGKNHYREGDFAEHVSSIRMLLADGSYIECSPTLNSSLFWATAGGMGMTGVIEEVTLRLKPITSASLHNVTTRIANIEDMIAAFEKARDDADYMIGWIDHMATGKDVGRGLFSAGNHISAEEGGAPLPAFTPGKPRFSLPVFFPSLTLNRYSMALHNLLHFKKYKQMENFETVGFDGFFHPLDSIRHWNRLYGKRGFFQYQCIIPDSPEVAKQLREFLQALQDQKQFSFLGIIKYHRESKGMLPFGMRGYSLALDFPNTARVRALLPQMDRWVLSHGGRIYLAKDAMMNADTFRKMYPQSESWLAAVRQADPEGKFASLMSERLKWKHAS
jgi:FAD/FMN-containing dehydrogenase